MVSKPATPRKALLTAALMFHLLLAVIYNLSGAGLLPPVSEGPLVSLYGRITGLACTYGFFSPQVASPCFLEVELAAGGDTLLRHHLPAFTGNDAKLRYHSFTTLFLDLAPRGTRYADTAGMALRRRLSRAFARSITEREAKRVNGRPVSLRVYVYRHPPLTGYHRGVTPTVRNLYTYAYAFPDR